MPGVREHSRERWFHWLKWGDYLLFGLIVVFAVVLFLTVPQLTAGSSAAAIILIDNKEVREIPLDQLLNPGETTLTANGFHYRLVWVDGRIRIAEADCPDQICVQTGWVSHPGQLSVCVPGKLILKLAADGSSASTETDEVDVIVK